MKQRHVYASGYLEGVRSGMRQIDEILFVDGSSNAYEGWRDFLHHLEKKIIGKGIASSLPDAIFSWYWQEDLSVDKVMYELEDATGVALTQQNMRRMMTNFNIPRRKGNRKQMVD